MKTRSTPRIVPDTPTYLSVKLDRGAHHFRIPSAIAGARLLKAVETDHIAALVSLGEINPHTDPYQLLALLRGSGPELLGLTGYVLGSAWFNEHTDLDTTVTIEDPMGTGEAVLEELHEAGYRLADAVLCALFVLREWMDRNALDAEVVERADFFGHRKDSTPSSPSTSRSTSSDPTQGDASTS